MMDSILRHLATLGDRQSQFLRTDRLPEVVNISQEELRHPLRAELGRCQAFFYNRSGVWRPRVRLSRLLDQYTEGEDAWITGGFHSDLTLALTHPRSPIWLESWKDDHGYMVRQNRVMKVVPGQEPVYTDWFLTLDQIVDLIDYPSLAQS